MAEGTSSVTKIPLEAFAGQCQRSLQPLNDRVSYFSVLTLDADQTRQYLTEPVAALPHSVLERLPLLRVILVPFVEKGPHGSTDLVCFERPQQQRLLAVSHFDVGEAVFLFLTAEQQEVADYHYWFFNGVAGLATGHIGRDETSHFTGLIMDEMNRTARGEVDERSYQLKQKMARRQGKPTDNKIMRQYVHQAMEDTLTLFLHGLCCDIDVEPGPRQLASRYLRKRLELLAEIFPPNPGFTLFPEKPRELESSTAER